MPGVLGPGVFSGERGATIERILNSQPFDSPTTKAALQGLSMANDAATKKTLLIRYVSSFWLSLFT
jgi:TctA family transporter